MPASFNAIVVESGDSLEGIMDDEAVVLVNHQSTSDVPVVMSALHNKSLVLGKVMWVMDDIFKYTNFGWISYVHGDFFIVQVSYLFCFLVCFRLAIWPLKFNAVLAFYSLIHLI